MFIFAIIMILLLIFLLIPIPLKFNIFISQENYYIKFYRLDIFSTNDGIVRKILKHKQEKESAKKDIPPKDKKETKQEESSLKKEEKSHKFNIDYKKLYKRIRKNKFKPSIKFDLKLNYSLGDAAQTAIFAGILYNLNPILNIIFSIPLKVKRLKTDINPIFKDKLIFEVTLTSIITFNLAQIIYMLILFIKSKSKN